MKKLVTISLIFLLSLSAYAKCYNSNKRRHRDYRLTDKMVQIHDQKIQKIGNALIDRRTGDKLFLATLNDAGQTTPIFQETLCSGEINKYIINPNLLMTSLEDEVQFREQDEEMFLYPGKMLAWSFSVTTERLILLPLIVPAEIIILPFSALMFALETSERISENVAQRRLRKLSKKDVKISHYNMFSVVNKLNSANQ